MRTQRSQAAKACAKPIHTPSDHLSRLETAYFAFEALSLAIQEVAGGRASFECRLSAISALCGAFCGEIKAMREAVDALYDLHSGGGRV